MLAAIFGLSGTVLNIQDGIELQSALEYQLIEANPMMKKMPNLDEAWKESLRTLGANAGFVEGLLYQYLEDPSRVDERWRQVFDEVASGRTPSTSASPVPSAH